MVVHALVDELLHVLEFVRCLPLSMAHRRLVSHDSRLPPLTQTLRRTLAQKLLHIVHVLVVVQVSVDYLWGARIFLDEVVTEMDFHHVHGALVLLQLAALIVLVYRWGMDGLVLLGELVQRDLGLDGGLAVLEAGAQLLLEIEPEELIEVGHGVVSFAVCKGQRCIDFLYMFVTLLLIN